MSFRTIAAFAPEVGDIRKEYFDGLRGWAALFVLFGHLGPVFLLSTQKLPVLPFFVDGSLAVYVFFVLSGYVLSVGFIERNDPHILKVLLVRRYPRLAIPIFVSCAIAYVMVQVGAMQNSQAGSLARSPWLESFYTFPVSFESLLRFALVDVYVGTNISYNAVLWTMPYELGGSLLLLVSLWVLRSFVLRLVGYVVATGACLYSESPLFAFVCGAFITDVIHRVGGVIAVRRILIDRLSWIFLGVALTAAMLRTGLLNSPIAMSLIAAVIVAGIALNSRMQLALTCRLSIFLGHISFPLYLTHLLVICSYSSWMYITLQNAGFDLITISIVTAASTVAISVFAAFVFMPVEQLAIRASRAFSSALLSNYVRSNKMI